MIAMLDTSHDLKNCAGELGCGVEQLFTPLTCFRAQDETAKFAIDNGAYSSFDRKAFEFLLERENGRKDLCRFVAVPDVVGSARRTLEVFDYWYNLIHDWPLALVAQDGQENLPIPWDLIEAVFIGGTTEWKLSAHAVAILKAAKAMGKWVHVGRVNTPGRFEDFEKLGADSIDGTGLSRYTWMRERIAEEDKQSRLFEQNDYLRNGELSGLLRESLTKTGDAKWHDKVYRALGEKKPSVRILKGKIPRYQQKEIEAGTLTV